MNKNNINLNIVCKFNKFSTLILQGFLFLLSFKLELKVYIYLE